MTLDQSIEERIRKYILKSFPLAQKQGIETGEKWLENGLLDSLGILDLVHFLEEELSIQVLDDELVPENFESLAAVVTFAQKKVSVHLHPQGKPCN